MRLVLRKALWLSVTGVLVGLMVAAALSRVLAGQLFGIGATDPTTYAAIAALLIAVALLAGAVPAIRATRINGSEVLRG
jgi:ABC-type antimicrobial peptide transport system permease subunit